MGESWMFDGRIVNRQSSDPIPDDEPIFVLCAKDRLAVRTLTAYFSAIEDPEYARAVAVRLEAFKRFGRDRPDRMKDTNGSTDSADPG